MRAASTYAIRYYRASNLHASRRCLNTLFVCPRSLPPCLVLILLIEGLLRDVARDAERNLMNGYNLAVMISPNLLRGPDPMADMELCTISSTRSTLASVVKHCIENYPGIYE
jgi:hypothetical protein